jgi:quercetin dioxygenase-like cupin family protein
MARTTIILPHGTAPVFDVFGPTIQFLVPPSASDAPYCAMRGVIPAGVHIPLHSHPEPESFYVESGSAQVLVRNADGFHWIDVAAGDFVHIPGGVAHAHRNDSDAPVVELIITAPSLGLFFEEIARPLTPGTRVPPPSEQDLRHFEETAARYRHWLATPEENAAAGIGVGPPAA